MSSVLLAFVISSGDEWCTLWHARTRGKAVAAVAAYFGVDFLDLSARRLPGCDDRPFTFHNALVAEFQYLDEGGAPAPESAFVNDCTCAVCERERKFSSVEEVRLP